jgi:hypothetical protein
LVGMHTQPDSKEPRRNHRPTLREARAEARRIADQGWAWEALHKCLKRVLEATIRGIQL